MIISTIKLFIYLLIHFINDKRNNANHFYCQHEYSNRQKWYCLNGLYNTIKDLLKERNMDNNIYILKLQFIPNYSSLLGIIQLINLVCLSFDFFSFSCSLTIYFFVVLYSCVCSYSKISRNVFYL